MFGSIEKYQNILNKVIEIDENNFKENKHWTARLSALCILFFSSFAIDNKPDYLSLIY